MKHQANKKQEEAFKEVVNSFKKARKLGLVFYAKSDTLVAYTKQADSYISEIDFHKACGFEFSQVPNLGSLECITDSGADDYGTYRSEEDEFKYSK